MDASGKVTGTPGEYQVSYSAKDAAGNESTLTAIITVVAEEMEFNYYAAQDMLALEQTVGGGGKVSIKYEDGIVYIKLNGACADCSLADGEITDTVETILTSEIPEVIAVEVIKEKKED